MKDFKFSDIKDLLKNNKSVSFIEYDTKKEISGASTLSGAEENDIAWIKTTDETKLFSLLKSTKASTVVVSKVAVINDKSKELEKNLVISETPKHTFSIIVNELLIEKTKWGVIHPSAVIHPEAKFNAKNVNIGANCSIGKVTIGDYTSIHTNVSIYDKVVIGNNTEIGSGTVIGGCGFGYSKNEKGENEKFPHIGGVVIGNEVEIGCNSCVDRGALGNTEIHNGVKIDNLVHIAHNVIIGKNSFVIANAMVAGSVKLGQNCWIAPSANILNGIKVDDETFVGIMTLVNKDTEKKGVYAGIPGLPLNEFKLRQKKIDKL